MMGFAKIANQIVAAVGGTKAITTDVADVADVEVEAVEATATTATLVGFPSRFESTYHLRILLMYGSL